ncbi:MAG TPA: methyltransferase [Polyangiales bacterium]|nr:methyltransferase [Polyangiales bacterium]
MARTPPPAVVSVTEVARTGLDILKRNLVPAPIAVMDLVSDFWAFHTAFTLAELKVPDALRHRARSSDEVARELSLDEDALYRVLRAATMIGLCKELPDRVFALKPMGVALCSDPQASFRDFIIFMGRHGTRFWHRLPDCVRTGKTAIELETGKKPFEFFTGDPSVAEDFNRAMTATSNILCDAFVAVYDFSFATTVVDIGGGHGRLLGSILQKAPKARGILFDLPSVVGGAQTNLESLGVAQRVEIIGGDFFEKVPAGGDCYVSKTVIHDWSDDDARKILQNIRSAMAPSARVLLYETVVGPRNTASLGKFLDLEMIVHAGGRERTVDEYRALFASAGLSLERVLATAGPMSIIEARAS